MLVRRRVIPVSLVAAFAAAGGTAWAVAQDGDPGPARPSPTTGVLARGAAPDGAMYEVSRIDPAARGEDPLDTFCAEIRSPVAAAQGCDPVPDADGRIHGQAWRPSLALLGGTRFFTAIAPKGVSSMEVRVVGKPAGSTSRSVDAGSAGTLLIVVLSGPVVTSRDPASSREYDVRLLDADGRAVQQVTMSDSP
jgi:hypothetical protein